MLDGSWPHLYVQLIEKEVLNKLKWPCLLLQIAIFSRWIFLDSTFDFYYNLHQPALTWHHITIFLGWNTLLYFTWSFSTFNHSSLLKDQFESYSTASEEISNFFPFWFCIPLFHFYAISKRIKLQKWDCTHLVDFLM